MLTECPECRYSLAGLPANHRCPECGFEYDVTMEIYRPRATWLVIGSVLLTVVMTPIICFTVYISVTRRSGLCMLASALNVLTVTTAWLKTLRVRPTEYLIVGRDRIVWRTDHYARDIPWSIVGGVTWHRVPGSMFIELSPVQGHFIPPHLIKLIGRGREVEAHFRHLMNDARGPAIPPHHLN